MASTYAVLSRFMPDGSKVEIMGLRCIFHGLVYEQEWLKVLYVKTYFKYIYKYKSVK